MASRQLPAAGITSFAPLRVFSFRWRRRDSKVKHKLFPTIAVALGLTTAMLAWLVEPLVQWRHDAIYHWSGRSYALFAPIAVDILVVWAVLAALLLTAQRPGRWRSAVWAGFLVLMPWILLRSVTNLSPRSVPSWVKLPPVWVAVAVWLALVLLWRPRFQKQYETVIDFASTVLAFVALSGAFFLSEFTLFWWQARALNAPRPLHREQVAATTETRPRIIWIVLDELSYRQVYGHRFPGLQLPAFDGLAKQAAVFTQVIPAANYTERAVPSLFTGETIDKVRSSPGGLLSLHLVQGDRWERFNEHDTVFQDALQGGYSTAVAGWFNPYCRILPAVLDRCYWADDFTAEDGMDPKNGTWTNLVASIETVMRQSPASRLWTALGRDSSSGDNSAELHIQDYRDLSKAADQVLLDRKASFAFLHLPFPHPPGFYDRETGRLTTGPSTYLDNLALADRYLAHVRSVLEQSGQWDSSTVIVMGDHGWRTTLLWETAPGWSAEEERASLGGTFDQRPGYIVKLAGQQTGTQVNVPFRAVMTRAMMDAIMQGKIRTADDLQQWAQQNSEPTKPSRYMADAR